MGNIKYPISLPEAEIDYIKAIVNILNNSFAGNIIGIYLFGSASYGGYIPGKSDLDIQIVTQQSLSIDKRKKMVGYLLHKNLPCPARKLEFVSFPINTLNPVQRKPQFDINLNTGSSEKQDHICFDPNKEPSHWFLLDIAIGRELGYALSGVKPNKAFGKVPRIWILEAMKECIKWFEDNEPDLKTLVINACRCKKFIETEKMCSKENAMLWAENNTEFSSLIKLIKNDHSFNPSEAKKLISSTKLKLDKTLKKKRG